MDEFIIGARYDHHGRRYQCIGIYQRPSVVMQPVDADGRPAGDKTTFVVGSPLSHEFCCVDGSSTKRKEKSMGHSNSLEATDQAAAEVQKTPHRVTLASLQDKIERIDYHNPEIAPHMTVAYVRMSNGFIVIGKSAPADPGNFDAELGKRFARDDAIRKIWPLEGYALCEALANERAPDPAQP